MKKEVAKIEHYLKGYFETAGGVSNYGERTSKLIEKFKTTSINLLRGMGIEFDWKEEFDESCEVKLNLVEIETGNTVIRSIMFLVPFFGNLIGPVARFKVEGEFNINGNNHHLVIMQEENQSVLGTNTLMELTAVNAATQFAKQIKYKISL